MACSTIVGKSTPAGDLVGSTDTQTLTNKTINIDTGGNSIVGSTWSILYTNGSGVFTELALGSSGQVLQSNGASSAPSFVTPSAGGNVSNTGTPLDSQIAVWTNSTTIEGDPAFKFDNTSSDRLYIGDSATVAGIYLNGSVFITDNAGTATMYNVDAVDTTTATTFNKYTIDNKTSTSWTLALSDNWNYIEAENASTITITVPPNSTVAFPTGSTMLFEQTGAGAVQFTPGSGVTLLSPNSYVSTSAQYEVMQLIKKATNTWIVIGGTATFSV